MPDEIDQPVVLDATVLSNFAATDSITQLVAILDQPVAVPAVRTELETGQDHHSFLASALDQFGDDISVIEPQTQSTTQVTDIRARLDSGEAASLLGAMAYDGTLATDDLAARDVAADLGVPVTGSIGILVLGVRRDVIARETANRWLDDWNEKRGYYAPVERIEDVLE